MALLLVLVCVRFPRPSTTTELDTSWPAVLGYAYEKQLQFGSDIVSTYGPLGFFTSGAFLVHSIWLWLLLQILLCYGVAVGICFVAWRMRFAWRVLFLAVFILVPATIPWAADTLLIEMGLLCWGVLCWVESGRRLWISALSLTGLAVVGALSKFTLVTAAVLTIAVVACDLVVRGRQRLGAGVVLGFIFGWLAGWLLLGQRLSGVVRFFSSTLGVSSGFNAAMGVEEVSWISGFCVIGLAVVAVLLRVLSVSLPDRKHDGMRRGLCFLWLGGLLFLDWKCGFVRADESHAILFLGYVPMIGLALESLPVEGELARLWGRTAAVACGLAALFMLQYFFPVFLRKTAVRPVALLVENASALLHPAKYAQEMLEALKAGQTAARLDKLTAVIGRARVDVFGQEQAYALLNNLDYHPRPVFQSFFAYSRRLDELNDAFYHSKEAPEFVLFKLAPIDERFPPLEDAFVLRTLLANYRLVEREGSFLLFRRSGSSEARLKLVREGEVRPGDRIELENNGDENVWLEIDLRPGLLGRLRQFIYKPPEVRLCVWNGKESQRTQFRAPAPMLNAGFLASPLVLANADVVALCDKSPAARPSAYAVELAPGAEMFWPRTFRFRIYQINNKLGEPRPSPD